MLSFSGRTRVFATTLPIDLRKGYDSLFAYCRDEIERDPLSGHLFLFINRNRDRLKALFWDGTGLVIIGKKLEKGKFTRLNTLQGKVIQMTASEFALLFEGADLTRRFIESPKRYLELPP